MEKNRTDFRELCLYGLFCMMTYKCKVCNPKLLSCTLKLATYNILNEQAAWSQLSCVTCLGWGVVNMMKGMGCYNLLEATGVLFLHQHIPLISQHWQCLPHIKDDTPEQVTVINANKTYCYHPIASSFHSLYQQSRDAAVKLWPSLVLLC